MTDWLEQLKRLQALAATGQHFTDSHYDRERYEEIDCIAANLLSDLTQIPLADLRLALPQPEEGYATPKVDVRGTVLRENREVLLVREAADGLWTLPGGYADLGLSAAENVEKEVWEEASIRVRARTLYAVRHKAKHPYPPDARDFYKFFFVCECVGDEPPEPGPETTDAQYFPIEALPELSRGRTLERDIRDAIAFALDPDTRVLFD